MAVCYFVDYDQSVLLKEEQSNMSNVEFFDFCSNYDKGKHGIGNWLRHFKEYEIQDVLRLMKGGALDLSKTSIFNKQKTTNSDSGIYHSIKEKDIFIEGSRGVDIRTRLLDDLEFKKNESVLDVGCNMGLLSNYLYDRGCKVSGNDNDPYIVVASKIVSNILGKDINYFHLDLDESEIQEQYDTIMLFSVLHHTRDVVKNSKKIASLCSRIILEGRLIERGKQPYGNTWIETSSWSFATPAQLASYCERLFPGFSLEKNLGKADKNRYILEFKKVK
jgi:2-polyprenyl-3-methyl-5-hydroxy-6-metoxy-1,4-benzoquinol methylase